MKHTRSIFSLCIITCLSLFVILQTGCASLGMQREPSVLIEREEPLFWELQGVDAKGNPATVYVFGTLNFAERTTGTNPKTMEVLSDSIVESFFAADRLVAEVSSKDLANLGSAVEKQMMKTVSLDTKVVDVRTFLANSEVETLNKTLGKSTADAVSLYAPWVVTSLLAEPLYKKTNYSQNNGLDAILINTATEQNIPFEGLDSLSDQINLLTYGTQEEQVIMLKNEIANLENPKDFSANLDSLYKAYISDSAKREDSYASAFLAYREKAAKQNVLYELYYIELLNKRNERWAKKIDEFMAEGGTSFVFAGAEHFVGTQSVFSYMEVNGTLVLNSATEQVVE